MAKCTQVALFGFVAIATIVVALLTTWFFGTRAWLRWSFDAQWSQAAIANATSIQAALDSYQDHHGSYPDSLEDLVPEYVATIPTPPGHPSSGGDAWTYAALGPSDYVLFTRCAHWVSSWDALAYRPSAQYPTRWTTGRHTIRTDGWIYVVGFSDIETQGL